MGPTPAAIVGYPSITVPMGFLSGLPVSWLYRTSICEQALIAIGYAYEQNRRTGERRSFEYPEGLGIQFKLSN